MRHIKKVDDDVLSRLGEFYGTLVPGLIIGAYMVELAYEKLGDVELVDAAAESRKCIADSVQLMTPCTLGNGWLKVYDWGIFAITLYDKKNKRGVRAYFDTKKLPEDSITYKWFFRKVGKSSHDEVVEELLKLKTSILSYEYVDVDIKKEKSGEIKPCKKCGYPFPSNGDDECQSCMTGATYYKVVEKA
jgi:formylmethanofuran dehydrogenase subunit E